MTKPESMHEASAARHSLVRLLSLVVVLEAIAGVCAL